jgi:hypothetical protein
MSLFNFLANAEFGTGLALKLFLTANSWSLLDLVFWFQRAYDWKRPRLLGSRFMTWLNLA